MNATIIARTTTSFTLQLEIPYNGSMLDFEETLQDRLNEAGVVATAEGLQQFDTDGSPITVGPVKFTSKGQVGEGLPDPLRRRHRRPPRLPESRGRPDLLPARPGRPHRRQLHPPLRQGRLAQIRRVQLPRVQVDLGMNHGREVSRCLIQDIADAVSAAAMVKEEDWSYALPKFDEPPATVGEGR